MSESAVKDETSNEAEELRYLMLNTEEPLLIKDQINWGLLKWSLEDWQRLLKHEKLVFRSGKKLFTKKPQWERTTVTKNLSFEEFVSFTKSQSEMWMYFDYKYLKEWFNNIEELKTNIDWSIFGFPELSSGDSTIWIGSAGAHTPCHIDTYGCNLIVQIYGRKQWILCPPEEDLKPTRVPYEESSIYSTLNFFSPDIENFEGVKNCRKIILEPGDALFVPHKWWHYVENLDNAISINVWIPLPIDDEERLKEALVQLFITQLTRTLGQEVKDVILNPNSDKEIGNMTLNASLNLINECKNINQTNQDKYVLESDKTKIQTYLKKYIFLQKIPTLSDEEFFKFLQEQRNRFTNDETVTDECDFQDLVNIVNAFTHSDSVSVIKNKLF